MPLVAEAATEEHAREELFQLESVRQKCIRRIQSAVAANPGILTEADVKALKEEVISDEALARSGATDIRKKIAWIQENIDVYIPQLEKDAQTLGKKFEREIREAQSSGWISKQSADRWLVKRLGSEHVKYWNKKKFIEIDQEKFRKYLSNWKTVAENAKTLRKHPQIKNVTAADVPQLSAFLNVEQFLNLSYEARESLVAMVTGALAAKEKRMPQLYAKAKTLLDAAARRQALSWSKVGVWLQRIFQSGAKPEQIEKFLNNAGPMPLQTLIENWSGASKHFQQIEAKRKSLGSPRGFHFVKMDVFLNWRFEQRKAYLTEAEHRFTDINKESYVFRKIRHEIGAKDWDAAEELIESVKKELKDSTLLMSEENRTKLRSLENFLKLHRALDPQGAAKMKPSPQEMVGEMKGLVDQLPYQLKRSYERALSRGYQAFWVLTTLMYNRVWCHQHNFLDVGKEMRMEAEAKDKTRERIDQGHSRFGHEVNVVKDDTNNRAAVRNQGGVKGAQVLYIDERSTETLTDEIEEQKNDRNFWYWTSIIPEDVRYPDHLWIVQNLHPQMKKLARQMESAGIRYSPTLGTDGASLSASGKKARSAQPSLN